MGANFPMISYTRKTASATVARSASPRLMMERA